MQSLCFFVPRRLEKSSQREGGTIRAYLVEQSLVFICFSFSSLSFLSLLFSSGSFLASASNPEMRYARIQVDPTYPTTVHHIYST